MYIIYYIRNIHILFVFAMLQQWICGHLLFAVQLPEIFNGALKFNGLIFLVACFTNQAIVINFWLKSAKTSHILHIVLNINFIFCPNNFSFLSHMFALKWQKKVVAAKPLADPLEILLSNQSNGMTGWGNPWSSSPPYPHYPHENIFTTSSKKNIANPHHERSVDHDRVHPHLESRSSDFSTQI